MGISLLIILRSLSDCKQCRYTESLTLQDISTSNWWLISLPPPAHHPSSGPACAERNSEEPAGPLQKLRRAHHHEDSGGSQRLSQGGTQLVYTISSGEFGNREIKSVFWAEELRVWGTERKRKKQQQTQCERSVCKTWGSIILNVHKMTRFTVRIRAVQSIKATQ